jgi:hypothetical protein
MEGLQETLTVHKFKIPGLLRETLRCTNPMKSANSACRGIIQRVTSFKDREMALQYAAAGFIEAERGFRRIKGYRQLSSLQPSCLLPVQIFQKSKLRNAKISKAILRYINFCGVWDTFKIIL